MQRRWRHCTRRAPLSVALPPARRRAEVSWPLAVCAASAPSRRGHAPQRACAPDPHQRRLVRLAILNRRYTEPARPPPQTRTRARRRAAACIPRCPARRSTRLLPSPAAAVHSRLQGAHAPPHHTHARLPPPRACPRHEPAPATQASPRCLPSLPLLPPSPPQPPSPPSPPPAAGAPASAARWSIRVPWSAPPPAPPAALPRHRRRPAGRRAGGVGPGCWAGAAVSGASPVWQWGPHSRVCGRSAVLGRRGTDRGHSRPSRAVGAQTVRGHSGHGTDHRGRGRGLPAGAGPAALARAGCAAGCCAVRDAGAYRPSLSRRA